MQKMDTDGITAQVEYAYVAQEADELSLTVGDIVKKCVQKENGKFINAFTFFLFRFIFFIVQGYWAYHNDGNFQKKRSD